MIEINIKFVVSLLVWILKKKQVFYEILSVSLPVCLQNTKC